MVNQSILETAECFTKLIPSNLKLKKAYLFGSYAKGNEHEDSDIDIAIVLGNMTDFFDTQMQLMRIRRKVDLRIEPHPISEKDFNATNPFALEIQNTGIELTLINTNQIASEPKPEYNSHNFDKDRIVNYWIESSEKDFKTMNDLYETKNYSWSLFMGHLVIEKLIKALYVKSKGEYPPLKHDLRRICEKADIKLDMSQQIIFDSISRFNINARYDDYKQSFYLLCTDSFTSEWIEKIINCRQWIKEML